MNAAAAAFLRSWPFAPWLYLGLLLPAAIYVRGWQILHQRNPRLWHRGKLAAFLAGLALVLLALGSPIEPFASLLLQLHMFQHLLLMMAAPPLVWLGAPMLPMIRGLPRPVRTYWASPVLRSPWVRALFGRLTQPGTALACYVLVTWLWHSPALYELALRSAWWHEVQHASFVGASLQFWYPIVRPYPSRPRWSTWLLVPCLLAADVSNTVLAALLTFSDRLLYPHYGQIPRLGHLSAIDDQSAAGVIMWVPGSVAFLVPLFAIGTRLLFGKEARAQPGARARSTPIAAARRSRPQFDVLRLPVLGPFLRWRHARLALQLVPTFVAGIVIVDGLLGTQVAAMNLAGTLPWIHWRALVVLGLLVAGNVSCMACPFLVPRTIARRWLPARLRWPRALSGKWPSVVLLVLFFWSYEAFGLWDSPRWTAGIVLGYFFMASIVDGVFQGASFCKHLCPIGQFNFVQSLVSPLEVKVRDPDVCVSCRTHDCIRGNAAGQPGCELGLYLPNKAGNVDCTFCLDCAHACPHENIGILAVAPARELWNEARRSGIGRFADRPDLAAVVLVLVFASFFNAAGMVGPVVAWQNALALRLGLGSTLLVTTACAIVSLVVLPALCAGLAGVLSERWGGAEGSCVKTAARYAYALVPLGFAMWLSHYSFHLLTGYEAAVPALQRFAARLGCGFLGTPAWASACCRPAAAWIPRLEIVTLDVGLLVSLYSAYRIALGSAPRAGRALAPWALLILVLFAAGVWIVLQPMEMRGTLARAG